MDPRQVVISLKAILFGFLISVLFAIGSRTMRMEEQLTRIERKIDVIVRDHECVGYTYDYNITNYEQEVINEEKDSTSTQQGQ